MPPTYPHLTAFPMSMALMTGGGFPFRILGVVHIRNEITQIRPIHRAEPLDFRVRIEEPREHAKGTAFDVGTQVRDTTGELVWSSTSTYLRRGKRPSGPAAGPDPGPDPGPGHGSRGSSAPQPAADPRGLVPDATWRLPADLGRRYAAVSGDRNPIHLYPWTARMFGFERQIAHGMWSAARCLAAIERARNTEADESSAPGFRFAVEFRSPVILPSTVELTTTTSNSGGATDFTLESARGVRTHLVGRMH